MGFTSPVYIPPWCPDSQTLKRGTKPLPIISQNSLSSCTQTHIYIFICFDKKKKENGGKKSHFCVSLDNICHSSPRAYSDWVCWVNRSKLTRISQGSFGNTAVRGWYRRSRNEIIFFFFRQGCGLMFACLSHRDRQMRHWKLISVKANSLGHGSNSCEWIHTPISRQNCPM